MKQGQFLKEVAIDIKLNSKITIGTVEKFLDCLLVALKVTQTSRHINDLPPGFDVLCGLKESCIYFGYWYENDYARLIVSSCKNFDEKKAVHILKRAFNIKSKIYCTINSSESIKTKVKRLWR
jgi:S-adenosylmethionine/arginine decarboxylase-like enzyme